MCSPSKYLHSTFVETCLSLDKSPPLLPHPWNEILIIDTYAYYIEYVCMYMYILVFYIMNPSPHNKSARR